MCWSFFEKQIAMLIFGPLLYMFDVGSDIYVAIELYKHGHLWWFVLTLIFIILPVIIINFAACLQNESFSSNETETETTRDELFFIFSFCTCTSVIYRYKEEIMRWKAINNLKSSICKQTYKTCPCNNCKKYRDQRIKFAKSSYKLAWLQHIAAVTESAPQWCLQVYIMLRRLYFPWYALLSTVISLLSLVWGITNLEITRQKKDGEEFKIKSKLMFLLWQFFSLVSRLFAIIYCAYVLKYFVFLLFAVHIILVTPCLFIVIGSGCLDMILCLLLTFSVFFSISEPLFSLENANKAIIYMLQFSHGLQNVLMLSISLAFSQFDKKIWLIATSCVVGGIVLGTAFLIWFLKSYKPVHIAKNDDVQVIREAGKDGPLNNGQENKVTCV